MSAMSGGSLEKAVFQSKDTGASITVQYNPTNFQFSKPVSWKEHDDQGKESTLEYQKNSPASMSCELIFDATASGGDVRSTWVNGMLAFTNPEVPVEGSLEKKRPHRVTFQWGAFNFLGVIESLEVSYLMFASNGNPVRAKVGVKMKEWTPESAYSGGAGAAGYTVGKVKLVTVGAGDTITSIAMKNGTTAQAICDANNISDPVNISIGMVLAIYN